MNRMRKIIALASFSVLVVAGCAAGAQETAPNSTDNADEVVAEMQKVIVVTGLKGNPFTIAMECGAAEAAAELGIEVEVQGPDAWDATKQNPILDAAVAAAPTGLVVEPVDGVASAAPLKAAQDAGIQVVLIDTVVEDASIGVSRITTDNIEAGKQAAKAMAELGVTGKVAVISTAPGVSSVDDRVAGFLEAASSSGFEIVGDTEYSNNEPAEAAAIVAGLVERYPDLAGIFATNLFTAQGVATGLKQAGLSDTVKVVGFDAAPEQIAQLQAGDIHALIAQMPYDMAYRGVKAAIAAAAGETVEPTFSAQSVIVTLDNLNDPEISKYLYKTSCEG